MGWRAGAGLDPNLANAHSLTGLAKLVNGHPEETERHELEALRISPHDTDANVWMAYIALSKLYLGAREDAVARYHQAFEINRNYATGHFYLAATHRLRYNSGTIGVWRFCSRGALS